MLGTWKPKKIEDVNLQKRNNHHILSKSRDMVELSEMFKWDSHGTSKLFFSFVWPLNREASLFWAKWHSVTSHAQPKACHSECHLLCSRIWNTLGLLPPQIISQQMNTALHKSHFQFCIFSPNLDESVSIPSNCGKAHTFKRYCGQQLEGMSCRNEFTFEIESWNKIKAVTREQEKQKAQGMCKHERNSNHHSGLLSLRVN